VKIQRLGFIEKFAKKRRQKNDRSAGAKAHRYFYFDVPDIQAIQKL